MAFGKRRPCDVRSLFPQWLRRRPTLSQRGNSAVGGVGDSPAHTAYITILLYYITPARSSTQTSLKALSASGKGNGAPLRLLFPKNLCYANLFREPCPCQARHEPAGRSNEREKSRTTKSAPFLPSPCVKGRGRGGDPPLIHPTVEVTGGDGPAHLAYISALLYYITPARVCKENFSKPAHPRGAEKARRKKRRACKGIFCFPYLLFVSIPSV